MLYMSKWYNELGTLSFEIPTRAMIEHVTAIEGADECIWEETPETQWCIPDSDELSGETLYVVSHKVWWWCGDGCDGIACDCGQLTLLEALHRLPPDELSNAIKLHADEMRGLYEHFWGGQGLVSGASKRIGDACPECLVTGAPHVWGIYENASLMAEEFGEALAAYAYELFVGEPRYIPLDTE